MTGSMDIDDSSDSVYENVRYRKVLGTVTLTAWCIQFAADVASATNIPWNDVVKHQVSPANYPKALLKLILSNGNNATFQLADRNALERIRYDISERLRRGEKRPLSQQQQQSFKELDPTALAVTRSSLLASNPALRQQHTYLVPETQTVSEDDFWETHSHLVQEEYARISGYAKAGTSSLLQSHLPSSGKVVLGVEEMRQIFILYPAVHRAYEEKVPLELSDEQFWRKYLESEYFHRDRGRIGTTARNHSDQQQPTPAKRASGPSMEEQDARAAAVGTDDMFSRYDQKLKEGETTTPTKNFGRRLAVGQFDLASTFETERGDLLEGPKDNHPPNQADNGKGSRVIDKYNRHWAMVLHPDEAVAGANLAQVARKSVRDVLLDNDEDAMAGGGVDSEMRRLVDFANAAEEEADHAAGIGHHNDYEPLTLVNVEAYYTTQTAKDNESNETEEEASKRHSVFAKAMAVKTDALVQSVEKTALPSKCFPPASLGKELLSALTKKMAQDSRTEAASVAMVNKLPEDFKKKLQNYFRRSSELLRHFFGLRKLEQEGSSDSQKLARIVRGMETFYREMEGMRKSLPQTETGEIMRKMCLPIMDQLDWAFQLHREGSSRARGGVGGFVAVDEG